MTAPDDVRSNDGRLNDEEHPREKQRGPLVLRRSRREEATTTDQRLLDSRGPTAWVHTDPWRVMRIQSEFVEGFGALAEIGPAIAVDVAVPDPVAGLHMFDQNLLERRLHELPFRHPRSPRPRSDL